MKGLDNTIALKEFVLKSKKVDPIAERPTYNACGDYVCMFNILNCSNHFGHYNNTVPVKGHRYAEGRVYFGCIIYEHKVRSIRNVDGIYTTREFYGVDPKLFDFPDLQQLSTLYWKPGLVINKDGEAECSFYTGDIAGKFRVVVQGVGEKELIYGQGSFGVR
jgi:hypothetical protein